MFNSIKPKNVEINITYEDKPEEEDLVSREQAIDDLFSLSSHIDNNVVLDSLEFSAFTLARLYSTKSSES